jgi:hypothetical protein
MSCVRSDEARKKFLKPLLPNFKHDNFSTVHHERLNWFRHYVILHFNIQSFNVFDVWCFCTIQHITVVVAVLTVHFMLFSLFCHSMFVVRRNFIQCFAVQHFVNPFFTLFWLICMYSVAYCVCKLRITHQRVILLLSVFKNSIVYLTSWLLILSRLAWSIVADSSTQTTGNITLKTTLIFHSLSNKYQMSNFETDQLKGQSHALKLRQSWQWWIENNKKNNFWQFIKSCMLYPNFMHRYIHIHHILCYWIYFIEYLLRNA